MNTEDTRSIYDRYVKGWSDVSDEEREGLLKACIAPAPSGEYADPVSHCRGPDGLAAVQKNFQRKTPKGYFGVDTFVTQNDRALVHWRALDAEGKLRFPGIDAVIFDANGHLAQISGFFDKPSSMS